MKIKVGYTLLIALVLLASCASTPTARVAKHRAAYNSWPADVQADVAAGRVSPGFTAEQVEVALGAPDRRVTRTEARGVSEIWYYRDNRPSFSFGLGVGSWGRSTATSVGIGVSDRAFRADERMRVTFSDGRVSAIESSQR